MARTTSIRVSQVGRPHFRILWFRWIIGGMLLLVSCIGVLNYFWGSILLGQEGVLTQGTIVATNQCGLYTTRPDSSLANQGIFLTILFSDGSSRLHRVTLPDCLPRVYQPGDRYAIKYVPADPSLVIGATAGNYQSTVPVLLLLFSLLGAGLGLTIVMVGAIDLLQQKRLYRSLQRSAARS